MYPPPVGPPPGWGARGGPQKTPLRDLLRAYSLPHQADQLDGSHTITPCVTRSAGPPPGTHQAQTDNCSGVSSVRWIIMEGPVVVLIKVIRHYFGAVFFVFGHCCDCVIH